MYYYNEVTFWFSFDRHLEGPLWNRSDSYIAMSHQKIAQRREMVLSQMTDIWRLYCEVTLGDQFRQWFHFAVIWLLITKQPFGYLWSQRDVSMNSYNIRVVHIYYTCRLSNFFVLTKFKINNFYYLLTFRHQSIILYYCRIIGSNSEVILI